MPVCTCCPNQAQDLSGNENRLTRFDQIYPLCEDCYQAVEDGVMIIAMINEQETSATRRHNALVNCLFQSAELDSLVEGCDSSHRFVFFGYWLISLSAKLQNVTVNELLVWAGNNRPEPILEGLRKAPQPIRVG